MGQGYEMVNREIETDPENNLEQRPRGGGQRWGIQGWGQGWEDQGSRLIR